MKFLRKYDFYVYYIKRKENVVVDALSRRLHGMSSMITKTDLRERILEGRFFDFSLGQDGLLCHKGCIYVPSIGDLYELIILEAHITPYATHLGVKKLHTNLRQLYYWPRIRM